MLQPRAIFVKDYRAVIKRTEDCIINAKTELAKRRLIFTLRLLDGFSRHDDYLKLRSGEIKDLTLR